MSRFAAASRQKAVTKADEAPGRLLKRAAFLEVEEAATWHPNRTYYFQTASAEETIARTTRELSEAPSWEAYCERAGARMKTGDYEGAVSDLENVGTREATFLRGEALAKLGRDAEAIEQFTACLPLPAAYYARASALNRLGDFGRAIDDYQRALELEMRTTKTSSSKNRRSLQMGAEAYAASREKELAREAARAAHARGVELRQKQDFGGAIEAYSECLAVDPRNFRALFDRAFARDAMGDLRGAVADYTAALELAPDHALAWYNRGIARERLGEARGALADFGKAISSAKHGGLPVADFYHNRAYCRRKLDDFRGAVEDYDRALARDPTHFKSLYNRAFCLDALGNHDEALEDYAAAIRLRPSYASAHHNRGVVLEKLGRLDDAVEAFDEALDLGRDNDSKCAGAASYAKALVLEKLGRFDDAGDEFRHAARLEPHPDYFHALGANLRRRGNHVDAVEAFSDALRADPNHKSSLANRAFTLRKLGRFDRAIADYTTALDTFDGEDETKLRLARAYCYARSAQPRLALDDYAAVLRLDPGNAHAYHNRAIMNDRLGRVDAAMADFQRVLDLEEERRDASTPSGVLRRCKVHMTQARLSSPR
ncbi:hypothetical protein CTAYLR_007923 [Chrysophaeum taylorii]|uniref:Tetratricopeptide repeat protein n=1 Tax=Chrysophaeum taylorii TaxID=2483200 RepID=A0AAD7U9K2_9STRA|nr:hypothetical protein CTAYLR_007923 [Chrysophaeum taylorii]